MPLASQHEGCADVPTGLGRHARRVSSDRRERYSTVQSGRVGSSGVPTNGQAGWEGAPKSRGGPSRRRSIVPVATGMLAAILVATLGAALLLGTAKKWAGQTTVVVLPDKSISVGASASYWDTLSRGQITSTVAQILALPRFKDLAGTQLHLDAARLAAVKLSTQQVTGTALVTVTAEGPNGRDAASVSDAVVAQAESTVNALIRPYSVTVVSNAGGHAAPSTATSRSKYLVILGVVAVALGFGVQQAVAQVSGAWSQRGQRAAEPPARTPEAGDPAYPGAVHRTPTINLPTLESQSHSRATSRDERNPWWQ